MTTVSGWKASAPEVGRIELHGKYANEESIRVSVGREIRGVEWTIEMDPVVTAHEKEWAIVRLG